ncbi:ROK family protein [Rhodobacteraceae bacterium RKSG542]|uniref:ROK family protein n=1 Tax=Pseudovibrio flavus TaxID=2529854 RepID=UPI0012BC36CA|nr:ROK family protein [Pseudovibrio flavus]MTI18076.1 ROK family protein [Pseudovibrio flavus]
MILCYDIGGSFMRSGWRDKVGTMMEGHARPTPAHSWASFVDVIKEGASLSSASAVSLSIAGFFDRDTGIATVANVPCLDGRKVQDELSAELGLPVLLTNDADCFALAEAHCGVGVGKEVVFGVILGTGVGGGLVVNGQLLKGHGGVAGEWGHGPIVDPTCGGLIEDFPAISCGCGHVGCIDAICSARGMEKLHVGLHGTHKSSIQITEGWHAGDEDCGVTIEIFCEHLARALTVMLNALGADVVPVSGGLASEPALLTKIDKRVREMTLAHYAEPVVVPGMFARNGGLVGAGIAGQQAQATGRLAA